jgi:hypothetical protein
LPYLGLAVSDVVLPLLYKNIDIMERVVLYSIYLLLVIASTILYVDNISTLHLEVLLLLLAFLCGSEMICFSIVTYNAKPHQSGLNIGVVNTFDMLSYGLLQQILGWLLDILIKSNSMHLRSAIDFTYPLLVLIVSILFCIIIIMNCSMKDSTVQQINTLEQ